MSIMQAQLGKDIDMPKNKLTVKVSESVSPNKAIRDAFVIATITIMKQRTLESTRDNARMGNNQTHG
jgi:hypothetical protein